MKREVEKRGEGGEKIEKIHEGFQPDEFSLEIEVTSPRDLNFEAGIVLKCVPKGPSETLWTHLGQPLGA